MVPLFAVAARPEPLPAEPADSWRDLGGSCRDVQPCVVPRDVMQGGLVARGANPTLTGLEPLMGYADRMDEVETRMVDCGEGSPTGTADRRVG